MRTWIWILKTHRRPKWHVIWEPAIQCAEETGQPLAAYVPANLAHTVVKEKRNPILSKTKGENWLAPKLSPDVHMILWHVRVQAYTHSVYTKKKKTNLSRCMPLRCGASCHHNKIQSIPANTKLSPRPHSFFEKLDGGNAGLEKILAFFPSPCPSLHPIATGDEFGASLFIVCFLIS